LRRHQYYVNDDRSADRDNLKPRQVEKRASSGVFWLGLADAGQMAVGRGRPQGGEERLGGSGKIATCAGQVHVSADGIRRNACRE
jgi:hypothetical protein